ncbi:DUF1304 domain-containing protein [Haemophilus influenzae]|uniref:DUF1304 domain-containing protein n=2 Tax=Haemophilus influenzae TaxID=727 RepID=UPI001E3FA840|nr:DUF1304 domain-containing protein [Haemophilus influenzae]
MKAKVVFANQGLYNGFLAAGIIFGYAINQISVIYFFLGCVIIAAVFGAVTTKNKGILVKQGLSAVLAKLIACRGKLHLPYKNNYSGMYDYEI